MRAPGLVSITCLSSTAEICASTGDSPDGEKSRGPWGLVLINVQLGGRVVEAQCSVDQRAALEEICSCKYFVNMIQGPPKTGKSTFAASVLIPIPSIFGLNANCYASSNATTEIVAGKISMELKTLWFHGVGKEWYDTTIWQW